MSVSPRLREEKSKHLGKHALTSRLNRKFHYVAKALDHLPAGTLIDGELVAMEPDGHPDFNLLLSRCT